MANEELKGRVLKRAVENFLRTGRGTQRFQLLNEFRERNLPTVINELIRDGLLRREMSGNLEEYAPSVTGIYLSGNQAAIGAAKAAFILVGGILRDVFFEQPGNLGIDVPVLLERAQRLDQSASKSTVLLGFYVLQDVGLTGGYRPGESGEILMVNSSEQLGPKAAAKVSTVRGSEWVYHQLTSTQIEQKAPVRNSTPTTRTPRAVGGPGTARY